MENVKGLCHRKNKPVLRGIRATLEKLDYRVWLGVLNAVDFQIPQKRQALHCRDPQRLLQETFQVAQKTR